MLSNSFKSRFNRNILYCKCKKFERFKRKCDYLIGTFCIVNTKDYFLENGIPSDLIGTFCIVNKEKIYFKHIDESI